jgi:hypothetical protein
MLETRTIMVYHSVYLLFSYFEDSAPKHSEDAKGGSCNTRLDNIVFFFRRRCSQHGSHEALVIFFLGHCFLRLVPEKRALGKTFGSGAHVHPGRVQLEKRDFGSHSNMAQRKRAGLITRRSLDRNQVLLSSSILSACIRIYLFIYLFQMRSSDNAR